MQFMDTHVHLQDFNGRNATEIITSAQKVGVSGFVCISAHENDWSQVIKIARMFPQNVVPALGIHPWYAESCSDNWDNKLETFLQKHPTAAIGECGIDRHKNIAPDLQEKIFIKQIEIAQDLQRPLIIHAVKAQAQIEKLWHRLPTKTVFHSFNSSLEFLRQIVEHGFYIGVNFSILRNPQKVQILPNIPLTQMLLETDAPYQPREKGEDNTPALLPKLAHEIALIRGDSIETFAQQTYQNANYIFKQSEKN